MESKDKMLSKIMIHKSNSQGIQGLKWQLYPIMYNMQHIIQLKVVKCKNNQYFSVNKTKI